jgi:trk system potassium uptake protein TrkA
MTRNIVIVGAGRVGRHVAEQLTAERNVVTVIEQDPTNCEQVAPAVNRVIEGDGSDPDVFGQLDLSTVDVVAALTDNTDVNLDICEMTSEKNADIKTILRIAQDGEQDLAHRHFVDSVVYPAAAGADVALDRITSA